MARMVIAITVFTLSSAWGSPQSAHLPKTMSSSDAASHLKTRVDPVFPPLAKLAKLGGTVSLSVVISPSGDVASVRVVSGHPLLVKSAIDAVKQWKYKPFLEDGVPVAVAAPVDVEFPGGATATEESARERFFPLERECRELVNSGKLREAEKTCGDAVEISNQLPPGSVLERSGARSFLAHAILLQRRFSEAIPLYEEALKLDQGYLKPNDADLATDYANLGRAYFMAGDTGRADKLYEISVSTFEAAIKNLPSMRENYIRRLKRTLDEYANLQDSQGQSDAAAQLRRKSAALAP